MPLESATYINQLNPAYPAATDPLEQGDDHLRLIKSALQATFPNITAPVTALASALNSPFLMPVGAIIMWGGVSVPTGWAVCDGSTQPKVDGTGNITTPDLRDRFVVGAGVASGTTGVTGGQQTANVTTGTGGAGTLTSATTGNATLTPTATIGGTSLTIAQMPAHSHASGIADDNVGSIALYGTTAASASSGIQNGGAGTLTANTSTVGNGDTHTHTATVTIPDHNHTVNGTIPAHTHAVSVPTVPPYYALQFIMKL